MQMFRARSKIEISPNENSHNSFELLDVFRRKINIENIISIVALLSTSCACLWPCMCVCVCVRGGVCFYSFVSMFFMFTLFCMAWNDFNCFITITSNYFQGALNKKMCIDNSIGAGASTDGAHSLNQIEVFMVWIHKRSNRNQQRNEWSATENAERRRTVRTRIQSKFVINCLN